MLPAAHGDAIWVDYGRGDDRHRILIDAGPASTYENLKDWLEAQPASARAIDLFVVTHIDADHIDGAIILLKEAPKLGVTFGDVWFDGWKHLQPEDVVSDSYGPLQGEFLGVLLVQANLPWNRAFDGGAVVVPDEGPLPSHTLPGGATLTLLSPLGRQLRRMRRNWETVVCDAGWTPGDEAGAMKRLLLRRDYDAPARQDSFGPANIASDNSIANGTSIAFVLEYGTVACLFTGDAYASVLADGLRRFMKQRHVDVLALDLVKLAHHGSRANVDEDLLRLVDSPRFLVSTNGAKFGHPDADALALVIAASRHETPELVFNYETDATKGWKVPDLQRELNYTAVFPSPNGPVAGITVEMEAGT